MKEYVMIGINEIASILVIVFFLLLVGMFILNTIKIHINEKFKVIDEQLDELRKYLYEIDPQFDQERNVIFQYKKTREANDDVGDIILKKQELEEYLKTKRTKGFRTLNTKFSRADKIIDIDV